jgi:CHAT domain-containing protein
MPVHPGASVGWLAVACLCAASADVQAPPATSAAAADARPLPTAAAVERTISAGQTHAYTLRLEAGQFLHAALRQQGIDISLALVGPDGKGAREADLSEGPQGLESLSFVAASEGEYRLELRARAGAIGEGRYALSAEPPRSPAPADRDRLAAEDLLAESARLYKDGRAESHRQAVAAAAKAVPLWRSLGEPFFEALSLLRQGASQRQLGEYHQARDLYTEALSRWRALGERLYEARTLDALGTAYFFLNEAEKALDHYQQALALRREVGDREGEAASLLNVGVGYSALGQLTTAVTFQQQALVQLRALGDRRREATLLNNMAVAYYFRTSRLQKALDMLQESLALSRAVGDRSQEAATLGTLAAVYVALGEPQDGIRHYRQALELWRVLGQRSGEAATLTVLGQVHAQLGDTETALEHYRQALDLRRAMQDRKEAPTLLGMGMAYKDRGDLARAVQVMEEGLRLSQETKDVLSEASLLSGLGQACAAQGDAAKAMDLLQQALALRQRLADRAEQAAVLYELARVDLRLGQVPRARQRLEAALELIEAVRDEVASHELRAALLARSGQVHDLYVDVLMREHGRDPAGGFETRAFEASERSRVQGLLEQLVESHTDLREGADPALLEREASLQEQLRFKLERQMRLLNGPHTEAQATAADEELQGLRSEYRRLQGQIRVSSPRYATLRQPEVLRLREVQERVLDPQTVLLEYALGDERSFLFAVTSGALRAHALPPRVEIEAAARRAYDLLSQRRSAEDELAEALGTLSRMLLEPVAGEIAGKRLLVVPDGALQYVPFGVLPVPGRPSVALVAEHEVVGVPSASLLAALRVEAAARPRPSKTLAVFADPVFDRSDERVQLRPAPPPAPHKARAGGQPQVALTRAAAESGLAMDVLPRLPYTRREASGILALVPPSQTKAALGFGADLKTALGGELADYRLVHFATHGFLNNTNPEMSGLVLSLVDRQGQPMEGFLSASEVFNLRLSADLVVLSGCRTALGKQMKGEGVVGLTRAFMYAGTSRVLASLWSVDDAATATLMTRFYEGILTGGLSPPRALQRAQLAVRSQRQWRQPYFWAGFMLQGDWK